MITSTAVTAITRKLKAKWSLSYDCVVGIRVADYCWRDADTLPDNSVDVKLFMGQMFLRMIQQESPARITDEAFRAMEVFDIADSLVHSGDVV